MSEGSSVPRNANLKQLKNQAKDLLRAFRNGEPDAVRELAEGHPRSVSPDAAKLTDAQLVLARRYGFDSWPKLRLEAAGAQLRQAHLGQKPWGSGRSPRIGTCIPGPLWNTSNVRRPAECPSGRRRAWTGRDSCAPPGPWGRCERLR